MQHLNHSGRVMNFSKQRALHLDWPYYILILGPPLFLFIFLTVSPNVTSFDSVPYLDSIKSLFSKSNDTLSYHNETKAAVAPPPSISSSTTSRSPSHSFPTKAKQKNTFTKKEELDRSRIAVCLVGGARRFELTGASIVEYVLKPFPTADLFLHSPLDENAFKLSQLKMAPRIASVRIFEPQHMQVTASQLRVLNPSSSPNGIQGLLQYFNLVEGCLTLIKAYQVQNNFTYDWIVRTRVDGYWASALDPNHFITGRYVVPSGSCFGGLNDRLGIGDLNTSIAALSRLSAIPKVQSAGYHKLNSEGAFKAQLIVQRVPYATIRIPFCIVSDRKYGFPPGVPVAAMSSSSPLSGAKCRACRPVCEGKCVANVMKKLSKAWSWTYWEDGGLKLCDPHRGWGKRWMTRFDRAAGQKFAESRQRISELKLEECINDFEEMRQQTKGSWDAPTAAEICSLGLRRT